jgi:hypothetical protein
MWDEQIEDPLPPGYRARHLRFLAGLTSSLTSLATHTGELRFREDISDAGKAALELARA